jgi:K+-sensing histidine kinase KdpD
MRMSRVNAALAHIMMGEGECGKLLAQEQIARARAEAAAELVRNLQAISDAALAHLPLDNLLHELLGRLRDMLRVDSLAVLLFTDDEQALVVRATIGLEEGTSETRVPRGWGIVGRIAESRQPIIVDDVSREPEVRPSVRDKAIRSMLGVPLQVEGHVIGVVHVGTLEPRHFDADEALLLQLAAERMALAIEHVRLDEAERLARTAAQDANRRSMFLAETSAMLDGSLDWEHAVESVARLAVPILGDWCIVDVMDQDQSLRRVAVAHVDPSDTELARELQRRYPPEPNAPHGIAAALRTGKSLLIPEVSDVHHAAVARDADHLSLLQRMGIRSVMTAPLRARGRTLGAITLLAAATQRRYSENDLELAEEVARRMAVALDNAWLYHQTQQAVRVRDQFLASASHDLRTPLSQIKGYVSTLLQTDVDWDELTRRDFLIETERATDRLDKLITDLLDISRIESGGLDSGARVLTEPRALVAAGLDRVRGLLGGRPLVVDVPAELPPVAVDATQLERVIANLIENAAKYSAAGGAIRVACTCSNAELELRVEDEGPGIPPEHLERIFEKFFRIDAAPRSETSGTGLGLAICRGIVRAHGGRIWAANQPGGGARFVVVLPLSSPAGA